MSVQTETSVILNPITLISHRKSILRADEQSLLPNYRDGKIIIEVGCGCHNLPNEIISLSEPSDHDPDRHTVTINHFSLNLSLYPRDHPAPLSMRRLSAECEKAKTFLRITDSGRDHVKEGDKRKMWVVHDDFQNTSQALKTLKVVHFQMITYWKQCCLFRPRLPDSSHLVQCV